MIGRKDSTTEKLYRILANFSRSVKNMIGATHSSDGAAGLVPPPRAGDEDKALLGNGTWGKVDSIYKYKTEEEYNQAVANNEIPDGATVIKEWDEELSVVPVDSELSEESLNPLQNKVIAQKIAELNQSIEELNGLLGGIDETLGGKLDVSKIANNLVTTEAGYALDARMGKELNDSVNNVINDINEIIHKLSLTATYDGNKCTINFNTHSTAAGLLVIYGNLSGTNTYFTAVLVKQTMYDNTIDLGVGGANMVGYTLSKESITIESNSQVTGIEHVKGIIIGM